MLPLEVLERAQAELLCYGDTGMSVMELGVDSPEFKEILDDAEDALRRLLNIPGNYKILFLQGGASSQFAAIPMNLLSSHQCADYIVSGQVSKKGMTRRRNTVTSLLPLPREEHLLLILPSR